MPSSSSFHQEPKIHKNWLQWLQRLQILSHIVHPCFIFSSALIFCHFWVQLHKVVFCFSARSWTLVRKETKMADESDQKETKKKPSEKPTVPRSATEVQKLKLEKLMKDPVSCEFVKKISVKVVSRTIIFFTRNPRPTVKTMYAVLCRIKRCQFPIFQSNGNHQKHLNLFDL